jgi:hypothetical protein
VSDPLTAALVVAAACVGAVVVAHVTIFRLVAVRRRARVLVLLWVAGLVLAIGVSRGLGVDGWRMGYGAVLVVCAFLLYMPFYYTIAASFSVGMLITLTRGRDGVPLSALEARHPFEAILAQRLAALASAGYARRDGAGYRLTPKGTLVARLFAAVKRLWRLGPGG